MQKKEVETRVVGPKFVKNARQWCVTIMGKIQKQEWFSTKEEAQKFITNFKEE